MDAPTTVEYLAALAKGAARRPINKRDLLAMLVYGKFALTLPQAEAFVQGGYPAYFVLKMRERAAARAAQGGREYAANT